MIYSKNKNINKIKTEELFPNDIFRIVRIEI